MSCSGGRHKKRGRPALTYSFQDENPVGFHILYALTGTSAKKRQWRSQKEEVGFRLIFILFQFETFMRFHEAVEPGTGHFINDTCRACFLHGLNELDMNLFGMIPSLVIIPILPDMRPFVQFFP